MRVYRHGDVNLIEVSEADWQEACRRGKKLASTTRHILARGEATGSVHQLDAEQMELVQDGETLWLKLATPGTLTHTSDHETLTVPPRIYRQVPEREVDHFSNAVKRVID